MQFFIIHLLQACTDKTGFFEKTLGDKEKSLEDARRAQADQTIENEKCSESLVSYRWSQLLFIQVSQFRL